MTTRQRQWLVPVLLLVIFLSGCVRITDPEGKQLAIKQNKEGYFAIATQSMVRGFSEPTGHKLVPVVKGSIYETGELMSVFGTCLAEDNTPINGTYAEFNAWYPNGTQFIFSQNMSVLSGNAGYFLHQSAMQNVQGTYLTSMDCKLISDPTVTASAFGEWQNPYWVKRIELLNTTLENLTVSIGNLTYDMGASFNITWDKLDQLNASLNQSVYALNQSIYYVASVANASVDRNDSYLAMMMQNLTLLELAENPTGMLNYTEDADDPEYRSTWHIKVTAISPTTGKIVQSPDSTCSISTTQTSPAVSMAVQGNHFVYSELISVHGDFSWMVTCVYT